MDQLFETKNYQKISLSPFKLNLFQECPLCFWLQEVEGVHRPETPTSTLPRGMDLLIKNYFDKYRRLGEVPPEVKDQIRGKPLQDLELLRRWRSWRTGLRYEDTRLNAVLFGALDECFVDGDYYIPVDYKTRGFELKEDSMKYYQTQLDCYTLLLQANGYKHLNLSFLVYFIPQRVEENGVVRFNVEAHEVKTDPERAVRIFEEAVLILRGPKPKSHSGCQFCSWGNDFLRFK